MAGNTALIESVFIGRDNEIDLVISDISTGVGIDFISYGVTKMEIYIEGSMVSSEDGYITYQDSGKVNLRLGHMIGLSTNRTYPITLIAYDPLHTSGQVLISQGMSSSKVSIRAYTV